MHYGIKQGSCLCPSLFKIYYIDYLIYTSKIIKYYKFLLGELYFVVSDCGHSEYIQHSFSMYSEYIQQCYFLFSVSFVNQ